MSLGRKLFLIFLISVAVASFFWVRHLNRRSSSLSGAVITKNADPRKQLPIEGVNVIATDGSFVATTSSDSSGLFKVTLRKRILRGQVITLRFRNPEYLPLDLTVQAPN